MIFQIKQDALIGICGAVQIDRGHSVFTCAIPINAALEETPPAGIFVGFHKPTYRLLPRKESKDRRSFHGYFQPTLQPTVYDVLCDFRVDTVEVCGSSPHGPTISFSDLASTTFLGQAQIGSIKDKELVRNCRGHFISSARTLPTTGLRDSEESLNTPNRTQHHG